MYVVAGLPLAVHTQALAALQARLPQAIIKGGPSTAQEGPLYANTFVDTLVRGVGEFAIRRRGNGNAQPSPASITLLFVPAPDQERLLQTFDFALMSAPLTALVARDENQRQLRHDLPHVVEALIAAVAATGEVRTNLNEVVRRLAYRSDNEGLLIPPRNFVTLDGANLEPVFREFRNGERAWTDRMVDIGPTDLTHDDVPLRIKPKQTRHPFVDGRAMAFFIAHPTAYDGPAREVEGDEKPGDILGTLRSLYRFGGPLVSGLHHDVQRADGSSLGNNVFHCSLKGHIQSDAPYANIYPNDFVRISKYQKV